MTNRELLAAESGRVLAGPDIERRRRLIVAGYARPCPWCTEPVSQIAAIGGDADEYRFDGTDQAMHCTTCGAPLRRKIYTDDALYAWLRAPIDIVQFQHVVTALVAKGIVLVRDMPNGRAWIQHQAAPVFPTRAGEQLVDVIPVFVPNAWTACDECGGFHTPEECPGKGTHVGFPEPEPDKETV